MQGAEIRQACLERWLCLIRKHRPLAFFLLSSLAKRRADRYGHPGWQKGLALADWKWKKSSESNYFSLPLKVIQLQEENTK